MKPVTFVTKTLALYLSFILTLPNSALALRVRNGGLEERTPVTHNLESRLKGSHPIPAAGPSTKFTPPAPAIRLKGGPGSNAELRTGLEEAQAPLFTGVKKLDVIRRLGDYPNSLDLSVTYLAERIQEATAGVNGINAIGLYQPDSPPFEIEEEVHWFSLNPFGRDLGKAVPAALATWIRFYAEETQIQQIKSFDVRLAHYDSSHGSGLMVLIGPAAGLEEGVKLETNGRGVRGDAGVGTAPIQTLLPQRPQSPATLGLLTEDPFHSPLGNMQMLTQNNTTGPRAAAPLIAGGNGLTNNPVAAEIGSNNLHTSMRDRAMNSRLSSTGLEEQRQDRGWTVEEIIKTIQQADRELNPEIVEKPWKIEKIPLRERTPLQKKLLRAYRTGQRRHLFLQWKPAVLISRQEMPVSSLSREQIPDALKMLWRRYRSVLREVRIFARGILLVDRTMDAAQFSEWVMRYLPIEKKENNKEIPFILKLVNPRDPLNTQILSIEPLEGESIAYNSRELRAQLEHLQVSLLRSGFSLRIVAGDSPRLVQRILTSSEFQEFLNDPSKREELRLPPPTRKNSDSSDKVVPFDKPVRISFKFQGSEFYEVRLTQVSGISPAGLEEQQVMQKLAGLEEAVQGNGAVVLEAPVFKNRPGLLELVSRVQGPIARRLILVGLEEAQAQELHQRNPLIQMIPQGDLTGLVLALVGLEEADRVTHVGMDGNLAHQLARVLPSSMTVIHVGPMTGLEELFAFMGVLPSVLPQVNASGLEEQLSRLASA